jgi:hypothetical protein
MAPRERKLLGLLVAFAVLWGGVRLFRVVFPAGIEPGQAAGRGPAGAAPDIARLRLGDLEARPGTLRIGRDPFRFGEPPPPPPPRPLTRAELEALEKARADAAAAQASFDAERLRLEAIPKPPPVDVTYLGSFGPETGKIAVLSDGTNIYNALLGDIVNGKFIVARIGYESVDLRFVGFPNTPAARLAVSSGPE